MFFSFCNLCISNPLLFVKLKAFEKSVGKTIIFDVGNLFVSKLLKTEVGWGTSSPEFISIDKLPVLSGVDNKILFNCQDYNFIRKNYTKIGGLIYTFINASIQKYILPLCTNYYLDLWIKLELENIFTNKQSMNRNSIQHEKIDFEYYMFSNGRGGESDDSDDRKLFNTIRNFCVYSQYYNEKIFIDLDTDVLKKKLIEIQQEQDIFKSFILIIKQIKSPASISFKTLLIYDCQNLMIPQSIGKQFGID